LHFLGEFLDLPFEHLFLLGVGLQFAHLQRVQLVVDDSPSELDFAGNLIRYFAALVVLGVGVLQREINE
jgi:hypothetical protein